MLIWPTIFLVLGQFFPALFAQDLPGVTTTHSNPSGVQCGNSPTTRCLSEATCTLTGNCQCPAPTYGDGSFQCYQINSVHSEVSGEENQVTTFHNTTAKLLWPCRFRFTEFETTRSSNGLGCHFQVFGVNKILNGRITLNGMEVHFRLTGDPDFTEGIGIRKSGTANNGMFTYTEWGRNVFIREEPETNGVNGTLDSGGSGSGDGTDDLDGITGSTTTNDDYDWGTPEELDIGDGQRVACEIDTDNFATVDVPDCGATIKFRAPDEFVSQQVQTPGLSVSVNQGNGPVIFNEPETYIAETPDDDLLHSSAQMKGYTVAHEILHRSMQYGARQYSNSAGEECWDTANTYRLYCQSQAAQVAALTSCSLFLENPDLISCMDPLGGGTSNSLTAFRLCLWQSCSPSLSVCSLLKMRVQQAGCMAYTTSLFDGSGNCVI